MEKKVIELNLGDVLPNRFQPRIKFSEESIQELANSIKEHGVIQPIVVRNIGGKYEIIAGERRYKASLLAGKQTIPAIITDLSEKDSAEVALIENVQRKDLTPIEEAISYKKILDMGYLTQDTLANKLGKTQSTIANKLRLLNLDDDVQEALLNEKISERHARSLLRLTNLEKQKEVLNKIINERLTVRKTDEVIYNMMNDNIEQLNFDESSQNRNQELEVFNPDTEVLNIPTSPILQDSIPEVLPTQSIKEETPMFNPNPEIIQSTVPPVPESYFMNEPEEKKDIQLNPIEEPEMPKSEELYVNNPGFMNIDKIEQESSNIFTEKPLAPVDNLLKSNVMEEPNLSFDNEPTNTVQTPEDILMPGKFFNLMPEEEQLTHEDNNSYSFDFNSFNNNDFNSSPETVKTNQINEQPKNEIENSFNFDFTDFNNNEINSSPEPVKVDTIIEQPKNEMGNSFNFDFINSNINDNSSVEKLPTLDSSSEFEVFPSTQELNKPEQIVVKEEKDLKAVIELAKNFKQELANKGFAVDIDEFDFENMYQIVFKINK